MMESYHLTHWTKESKSELIRTIWPKAAHHGLSSSDEHYTAFYSLVSTELAALESYPTSYTLGSFGGLIRAILNLKKDSI